MKRNRARIVTAATGAFLVCLALAACGRQAPTSGPTAAQPAATSTAGASASPVIAASESPSATDAPSVPAGPPTPDPVASELDQINQLINDINNSVQSSDTSQQGGE